MRLWNVPRNYVPVPVKPLWLRGFPAFYRYGHGEAGCNTFFPASGVRMVRPGGPPAYVQVPVSGPIPHPDGTALSKSVTGRPGTESYFYASC